jgi:hypothetical protein
MEQLGNLAGKCGIYKITFPNGHYYYGQSINMKTRKSRHLFELKKGVHSNKRLQNCYNKYKDFTFDIIQECSKEELNSIETKYLFEHVDKETGEVRKREDGKVLKPVGWTPPDLKPFVKE